MKNVSDFCLTTNDASANIIAKKGEQYFTFTFQGGDFMPLVIAPAGQNLKVIKVLTGEKTKKHLESLGITINSDISVISKSGGSVIILVKDGRLALDNELATKIMVA